MKRAAKKLRAVFERKPIRRTEELHLRLRPDEAARYRLAVAAARADDLSTWLRALAAAECDRLGIPSG
jgi:hypothetical protein